MAVDAMTLIGGGALGALSVEDGVPERAEGCPDAPRGRARITVVGSGHCLMPKDRVGPRVLELLVARLGDDVELRDVGTTGLGLLDHLDGQDLLIVVDACIAGLEPGQVLEVEPDLETVPARNTSVHQIGPVETLVVAKHLYPERMPRMIRLVLVETSGIDLKTEEIACLEAAARIERCVRDALGGPPRAESPMTP